MSLILVDLDGPIADLESKVAAEVNQTTGMYIDPKDRVGFHIADQYQDKFGYQGRLAVFNVMKRPLFYATFDMVEGAEQALCEMISAGHEVRICTAPFLPNPTCASDKMAWVEENLGEEWMYRMIITKDKTWVTGDVLIDDKPQVTGILTPTWRHVIFEAPYNFPNRPAMRWSDWKCWV